MTLAYFDTLSGVTGEMLLGALLDAGLDHADLESAVARAVSLDVTLPVERVTHHGVRAVRARVRAADTPGVRHLTDVLALLDRGGASPRVKDRATRIWIRLMEAEAKVSGAERDLIEIGDVGGLHALAEIVGVCEALERLQVSRVHSVPLTLSSGLAASDPAVTELVMGAPVRYTDGAGRMTSVGAAILTSIADAFVPPPAFTLRRVGYGAGDEDGTPAPVLVRVCLGEADAAGEDGMVETDDVIVVEANIDDMNPQFYSHVVDLLFERGALDAYLIPIIMKKGRPGTLLAALVDQEHLTAVTSTMLDETTTIGVRTYTVHRRKLPRRIMTVTTRLGPVRIKVVRHGERVRFAPEYEDCLQTAQSAGVSLADVYDAVRAAVECLDLNQAL